MNTVLAKGDLVADITTSGERACDEAIPGELAPGTCIHGKYIVHGTLGYGGFAVVYDAEHVGLGRPVAIKVLHLHSERPQALVERFRREARISALVRHPNVLEVYDTGALADGSPYLVMERLNGENLSAMIARGPMPIAMVVELGRQLMLGLGAVADAGIVHRDIKPDNVMLHDSGDGPPVVKLVDFGISKRVAIEPAARLTCHGALVGTPQYMSPEQIRGEDVDVRTDLYSTGAVLYEALTGHAPHESNNFSELVVAVLNGAPEPIRKRRANCPPELERAILKALMRDRAQRFSAPRELMEALEEVAYAYELPTGAEAFSAIDRVEPVGLAVARSSFALSRRFRPLKRMIGESRALQLTLVTLLIGAQGAAMHVYGEEQVPAASTTVTPFDPLVAPKVQSASAASVALMEVTTAPLTPPPSEPAVPASPPERASAAREAKLLSESAEREARAPSDGAAGETKAETERATQAAEEAPSDGVAQEAKASSNDLVRAAKQVEPLAQKPVAQPPRPTPQAKSAALASQAKQSPGAEWEKVMQDALAALVRGRLEVAKARYQQAARIEPREPTSYRGLGLVAARLGQHREAREALGRYLTLAPKASDRDVIAERVAALPQ